MVNPRHTSLEIIREKLTTIANCSPYSGTMLSWDRVSGTFLTANIVMIGNDVVIQYQVKADICDTPFLVYKLEDAISLFNKYCPTL